MSFLPEFEWTRVGRTFGNEGETNRYSLSPLFAVVGTAPFSGEISRVSFKLDDAGAIFYDQEAFGSLSFGKEKEARTILRNAGIKIGPNVPFVSYWTGNSRYTFGGGLAREGVRVELADPGSDIRNRCSGIDQ